MGLVNMRNVKIKVRYKGTSYCGWQSQTNGIAVQDVIKKAIEMVTGEKVKLIGAGRTDAGVHSLGQTANFITGSKIPTDKMILAINANLPDDVVVFDAEDVDMRFNARYDAKGKLYRYCIWNSKYRPGLFEEYCYWLPYEINLRVMNEALYMFMGTHDFKNFMSTGGNVKKTIRTLWNIDLTKRDELVFIDFKGDGFLYNMVRRIAGCLVDVGRGELDVSDVRALISNDNDGSLHRYITLPAKGLFLVEVYY